VLNADRGSILRPGSSLENRGLPATGWETLAIGGERGTQVRVVTRDGRIERWRGSAWTLLGPGIRPANDFDAWSWWRSPSGRLFAAGTGLVVLPGAP
jgi:hypothetical protein